MDASNLLQRRWMRLRTLTYKGLPMRVKVYAVSLRKTKILIFKNGPPAIDLGSRGNLISNALLKMHVQIVAFSNSV